MCLGLPLVVMCSSSDCLGLILPAGIASQAEVTVLSLVVMPLVGLTLDSQLAHFKILPLYSASGQESTHERQDKTGHKVLAPEEQMIHRLWSSGKVCCAVHPSVEEFGRREEFGCKRKRCGGAWSCEGNKASNGKAEDEERNPEFS